jgi:hypothetical protein
MTTCANCDNTSVWIYEITPSHTIPYCGLHLPKFLNNSKNAGLLKRSDEMVQEQSDAFEVLTPKSSKKSSKAVVEETPAEETPVVEEVPAEEEPTTPGE